MSLNPQQILIVDDELDIREGLKFSLGHLGYDVHAVDSGENAIYYMKNNPGISCVITDFRMPGIDGFEVLKEIKKVSPQTRVVLMTGHGSVNHAVQAIQRGADDYLCKPFELSDLEALIAKPASGAQAKEIITGDTQMVNILRKAERAAKSSAPILIEGPSGTGKELLAKQIHDWSNRSTEPWVAVNCAALPSGLLESELFGFERGAFTGAVEKKIGRFEQANGGTLLLDEIGELDLTLQAKLLRVLQEGELDRLGGRKPLKINVRIIATTNKGLEKLVSEGKFREDLYFRLYGVRFTLPALRERRDDIEVLATEFLKRQSQAQGRDLKFSAGVTDVLKAREWFGNIRELERAIERAAVLSETGEVDVEHFEFEAERKITTRPVARTTTTIDTQKPIRDMEREIIMSALTSHHGNRTHTAKSLGMSLRTLRHKLKLYREAGFDVEPYSPTTDRQNPIGKNEPGESFDALENGTEGVSRVGNILAVT